MAYVLREGQGSLFKNDNRTSDNHPNARGEILIGGVLYEISAWTKEGAKGKFQSLSAKPKQERRQEQHSRQVDDRNSYGQPHDEADIPF